MEKGAGWGGAVALFSCIIGRAFAAQNSCQNRKRALFATQNSDIQLHVVYKKLKSDWVKWRLEGISEAAESQLIPFHTSTTRRTCIFKEHHSNTKKLFSPLTINMSLFASTSTAFRAAAKPSSLASLRFTAPTLARGARHYSDKVISQCVWLAFTSTFWHTADRMLCPATRSLEMSALWIRLRSTSAQ